jgi:hypothetical protein
MGRLPGAPPRVEQYRHAVVEGMPLAEGIAGSVAMVAGTPAFLAMGARDPLRSVWGWPTSEHRLVPGGPRTPITSRAVSAAAPLDDGSPWLRRR